MSQRAMLTQPYKVTSLEDGSRGFEACIFMGTPLVSKRLCIRRWQCYHCPFYDQITYRADMAVILKLLPAGEARQN